MKPLLSLGWLATAALCVALAAGKSSDTFAASASEKPAPAPSPLAPPTALSLQEARVIIDAAVAYTRELKLRMTIVVLDEAGQLISADRMEGASFHLERFAKGKAYASLMLRDRTETAAQLAKSRPDRYFGVMNMYPGEVYLVGGGIPLAVGNRLVGAVGVAGLPQGMDDKAAEAGIAAWNKFRESMKK